MLPSPPIVVVFSVPSELPKTSVLPRKRSPPEGGVILPPPSMLTFALLALLLSVPPGQMKEPSTVRSVVRLVFGSVWEMAPLSIRNRTVETPALPSGASVNDTRIAVDELDGREVRDRVGLAEPVQPVGTRVGQRTVVD